MMVYMHVCMWEGRRGRFVQSCREGEWKSPLYRMKASEDYPLTMKCDDPPSPSDTKRVQLNTALFSYKTPASSFILLHCT